MKLSASLLVCAALAVGCGDDDDDAIVDGGAGDGSVTADGATVRDSGTPVDAAPFIDAATTFSLSSSALAPGAAFSPQNTCAGANQSPPLTWTAGPAGTMSYAIVFQDLSNQLRHWVIWDIPASVTSLPAGVMTAAMPTTPAGAKQTLSYDQATYGYLGPCPRTSTHTYRFTVFALGVATLTSVTTSSTAIQVHNRIQQSDLATATLTGMSNASPP